MQQGMKIVESQDRNETKLMCGKQLPAARDSPEPGSEKGPGGSRSFPQIGVGLLGPVCM